MVETAHRDACMHSFRHRSWDPLPDDIVILEERRFDYVAGEIEATHTHLAADGTRESHSYRLRVYSVTELAAMLEVAGFGEIRANGGLEGAELSEREWRLAVVAKALRPGNNLDPPIGGNSLCRRGSAGTTYGDYTTSGVGKWAEVRQSRRSSSRH